MTQEDKEILLKDICARLPYGVMLSITHNEYTGETFNARISTIDYCNEVKVRYGFEEYEQAFSLEQIKPYLFPLSSMTEEQKKELDDMFNQEDDICEKIKTDNFEFSFYNKSIFDFLNKYHLDYRGLIPMGLANDATGLNIY